MNTSSLCPDCGLVFSENWMLKEHKRVTHDERILKCKICNVEVVGLNKMKAHKQKHKQKECQKCSLLVFANSWSAHQSKCSETQLKCNICSYETSRKGHLQTHIKSVHNTVKKEKVQIDHKCVHCKKSFKIRNGLDRHIKIHSSIKELPCLLCNKFTLKKTFVTRLLHSIDD